jgi:hypothetical protein
MIPVTVKSPELDSILTDRVTRGKGEPMKDELEFTDEQKAEQEKREKKAAEDNKKLTEQGAPGAHVAATPEPAPPHKKAK